MNTAFKTFLNTGMFRSGIMKRQMLRTVIVMLCCLSFAPAIVSAEIAPLPPDERASYEELSPFEFKNVLGDTAQKACSKVGNDCRVLNAGRGNPNFMNTTVREAFSHLNTFASSLAAKSGGIPDLGFQPEKRGIARKLRNYLKERRGDKSAVLLLRAVDYSVKELGLDSDDLVIELTNGVLGDYYPDPPRMLQNTEKIVSAYLSRIHFTHGGPPKGKFALFATEGATAAMIYVFQSLKENGLLVPGDSIAVITPIFSPYLEIPLLNDFELRPIYVMGDEDKGWQVPDSELEKLKDAKVKALFMVNPMNPGSASMSGESITRIANIIKSSRQNLIVLTDTVYAPFVDNFHDLLQTSPENTIGVYSYSKYFGVTGWRLGVIMLHENNIIDNMIARLPMEKKKALNGRYGLDDTHPESIKFIDRLVMDSRAVALAHTGGLSTPQQTIMALFSLFELMDKDHVYKKSIQALLKKRMDLLYQPLGIPAPEGTDKTRYYALVDIGRFASARHGKDFADYLAARYSMFDFLLWLAREKVTVLLPGEGFAGPKWSLRVSLANLPTEDYATIGKNICDALDAFHDGWANDKKLSSE